MDELTYLKTFNRIVRVGISFGSMHPLEMWVNYLDFLTRMPTILPANEDIQNDLIAREKEFLKASKRYFNEMYEDYAVDPPATPEKVEKWIRNFYPETHAFKADFEQSMIEAYNYEGE